MTPTRDLNGGGGADVEELVAQSGLFLDRFGDPHVPVGHKCVLAARSLPERLTV